MNKILKRNQVLISITLHVEGDRRKETFLYEKTWLKDLLGKGVHLWVKRPFEDPTNVVKSPQAVSLYRFSTINWPNLVLSVSLQCELPILTQIVTKSLDMSVYAGHKDSLERRDWNGKEVPFKHRTVLRPLFRNLESTLVWILRIAHCVVLFQGKKVFSQCEWIGLGRVCIPVIMTPLKPRQPLTSSNSAQTLMNICEIR